MEIYHVNKNEEKRENRAFFMVKCFRANTPGKDTPEGFHPELFIESNKPNIVVTFTRFLFHLLLLITNTHKQNKTLKNLNNY